MTVKNRLKEILDERGTKNVWLAEKANVNNSTLGNIIKNRHNPSIEVAIKIARALGMKVEDIWIVED